MNHDVIRVVIADDHPIVRQGLRALFSTERQLEVVAEAANGREAVAAVERFEPDVILMDLVMDEMDGVEAIRRIVSSRPEARIVVLTSFGGDRQLFPALEAGALGFMLKETSPDELIRAIRSVAQGDSAVSPIVARRLLRELTHAAEANDGREPLTLRETEVLRELAHGLSNEEIGKKLFISPATVRTHVSRVFAKLNLTRRTQAVLYALRHGIATLDD